MKIKLTISYDGTKYNGSQIQPDCLTVQSALNQALQIINITTTLEFSGRTDKGVHAFGQVVSCTIPNYWTDLDKLTKILNKLLDNSIFIKKIIKVSDDFHARFSAKKREYRYLISKTPPTPFNADYLGYYENIDEKKIIQAIDIVKGIHDFKFFSKTGSNPNSTTRQIYNINFYKYKNIYILQFCANSYLRSQIRMLVDFILKISQGKLTTDQLKEQLETKKKHSWILAPSSGLYLSKIRY
jgi:tRNA pseudouridine38-40 synthase